MFYRLLLAALVACGSTYHLDLDFMTSDDMERYFSVSRAEEVPEYEIVSPTAYSAGGRRKRHIEIEETSKEIKLQAFGEEFHMKLEENQQLLAEGLHVDIHNADGTVEKQQLDSRRCFYHGELLSHDVSRIAVSTCNGLTGMIATDKHDIYIRPLTDKHAEEYRRRRRDIDNPHIIYRKSVDQDTADSKEEANAHFCALDPEFPHSYMFHETMEHIQEMAATEAAQHHEIQIDFTDDMIETDPDIPDGVETEGRSRRRRATGTKYLEVRVAADADMANYYQGNVISYTLTLMNIVAARFIDPSLGITIIIHIVKLDVFTSDTVPVRNPVTGRSATLSVSPDGVQTLDSWSAYQYVTNSYNDINDVGHWDNAVMISRKNLQLDGGNSLLGIARGNTTCYSPLQASVSEDAGLSSGNVIAHEIGHTLGIEHDNTNGCTNSINVMSSHRPNGAGSFVWSSCSVEDLKHFLLNFGRCLDDTPVNLGNSAWPINAQDRPGSEYDADQQCRLLSDGVTSYTGSCIGRNQVLEDICANLYCLRESDGFCFSQIAAAEGTFCGPGKWCVSGQCVLNNVQNSNEWRTADGPCSVTCGTGTSQDIVRCYSLTFNTYLDDSQCDSSTKPTSSQKLCTLSACPTSNQWIKERGPCSVTCGNGLSQEIARCFSVASNIYLDDSQCDPTTRPATFQQSCFVTTCPTARWQPLNFEPCTATCGAGTQAREVWCVRSNGQSLARVADSDCDPTAKPPTTQSCSNPTACPVQGVWVTGTFTQCLVTCGGGSRIRTVSCRPSATSQQTLPESQCSGIKPNTIEACNQQNCPANVWVTSAFSQCSVTCGGGSRIRTVSCRPSATSQQTLPESQCSGIKPNTIEACNQQNCPTNVWVTSAFSQCSVTCGGGSRIRTVSCRPSATSQQTLHESQCSGIKPNTIEACNQQNCPTNVWVTLAFSQCSRTCGGGTRTRAVSCRPSATSQQILPDSQCQRTRPHATENCNQQACPPPLPDYAWYVSPTFGPCSVTCGTGTQSMLLLCVSRASNKEEDHSFCPSQTRPQTTTQRCTLSPCSPQPPTNNAPDQGAQCAGVYTRPVNNLDRISSSTGGKYCKESIVAPPGQNIKLTFNQCNIRCSEGTDRGYVRDGDVLLQVCCDGNDAGAEPYSWTSATHVIQLEHLTAAAGHGYEITVEFVGQPKFGCDKVFTSPTGTVTSPNYPGNYGNNQLCQSVIIAPPGKRVKLHFQDIQLHSWSSYFCFDQFVVVDLDSGDGLRYCGSHKDPSRLNQPSLDNRVLVEFASNNDGIVSKGFALTYNFVDA